ncbi:MAG: TIGR04283 family arsenosugar biosynthesis glycosyltransferase [Pirellulales bacterium]|nr:TIGR04283 family arsenosugar biosynthesis glycosyltransferase [Pirellulales bacterium]
MPRWLRLGTGRSAERLLIFARYPEVGTTKTRLIPALGASGAARLHADMVRHTLAWADDLARVRDVAVEIHFAGGDEAGMRREFGAGRRYRIQAGADLGARMAQASAAAFAEGATRIVIVGTDCPELSAERVAEAFRALDTQEVALGPAVDGGYYLIGLARPRPALFAGIDWGTERVLEQTLAVARRHVLSVASLGPLADVDEPGDLPRWQRVQAGRSSARSMASLSIIIPTLDEAGGLAASLGAVRAGIGEQDESEVIVVDGGSRDDTVAIAREHGATVIAAEQGRAYQMNAGGQAARGDTLLFLHADTLLPQRFASVVNETLGDRDVLLGAFRLRIEAPGIGFRAVEQWVNWRATWRGLPYGDQALFMPAWVFRTLGGFPTLPIMEDFVLVDTLRRRGRVAIAPDVVCTSARRWQRLGVVRTTLVNQAIIAGYRLGISPQRLAAWYRAGTKRD